MVGEGELECPACGYDLRGQDSDVLRCPECGSEYARETMSRSRIAWTHRREIGFLKAWARTCWMAMSQSGNLAFSLNAPLPYAEARRFWAINVVLISAVAACWVSPVLPGISRWLESRVFDSWAMGNSFLLALANGVQYGWVWIVGMFLSILFITASPSYLLQMAPLSRFRQDRAVAAGLYLGGALMLALLCAIPVAALLTVAMYAWRGMPLERLPGGEHLLIATFGIAIAAWWCAVGRGYQRICRGGRLRGFAGCVFMAVVTVLGLVVPVVLIAFFIGVCRLIYIDI